jgi:hypothetical protein
MQTEADRIATRVSRELSKPHGYMVTRFWVMDAAGLYYAGKGEFSYDQDDAIQSDDEAEAEEVCERHPGTTVERFERWSQYQDLVADPKDHALSEALNFVQHWRRDRDVNLAPTLESLNHVEAVLRNAIASAA